MVEAACYDNVQPLTESLHGYFLLYVHPILGMIYVAT